MNIKNNIKYYVSSLFLSFSALTIFLACIVISNPQIITKNYPESYNNIYLPSAEDKFNILLSLSSEENSPPFAFFLVNFDPVEGKIPVVALPPSLYLEKEGKTLLDLYNNFKAEKTAGILGDFTHSPIDKYICLTGNAFGYIMEMSGNIKVNLPAEIRLSENFSIKPGEQILDGETAFEAIRFLSEKEYRVNYSNACSDIMAGLINNLMPHIGKSKGERIFNHTVNNCLSNVSYMDYESVVKPAEFMVRLAPAPSYSLALKGEYDGEEKTFKFSESSFNSFIKIFK